MELFDSHIRSLETLYRGIDSQITLMREELKNGVHTPTEANSIHDRIEFNSGRLAGLAIALSNARALQEGY